ncbi:MAG: site-2 protease family protein [Candidatus Methanodesulfokora washburnensis]|jgi:membrane-associated protease RseP (regulator of RpoE activity)
MTFDELTVRVHSLFAVKDYYLVPDGAEYIVAEENEDKMRENFLSLMRFCQERGYIPRMFRYGNEVHIRVIRYPIIQGYNWKRALLLFLATIGTVMFSGYLLSSGTAKLLSELNVPFDITSQAILYSLGLLLVLGIHEAGHMISKLKWGGTTELPYFIPFIPPWGTLGAVIASRKIPANRDELMDLGISGPVAGFLVALVVSFLGIMTSSYVPEDVAKRWTQSGEVSELPMPLVTVIMERMLGSHEGVLLLSPLAISGVIGLIITFLNLLPVSQLDGGHVIYSLIRDDKKRMIVSLASLMLAFMISPAMALFLAFFMIFLPHPPPLDECTGISRRKKVIGGLAYAFILIMCLPIP